MPAPLTISTGSASKEYDGTALTTDEVTVSGLQGGDSITVATTGTITDAGTTENTYTIDWGTVNEGNYEITESDLGTLTIDPVTLTIDLGNAAIPYDKKYHAGSPSVTSSNVGASVSLSGISSFTVDFSNGAKSIGFNVSGGGQDAGVYTLTCDNFYAADGGTINKDNYSVTFTAGTMTIEQAEICVDLNGSAYDRVYGEAVTAAEIELPTVNGASVTPHGPSSSTAEMWQRSFGAIGGDAFTLTVSGWNDNSVGTHDLNTEISFTSGEKTNYRFRFTNGSYTVSKAPITIETASEEKTYDGVPLPETAAAPTIIGTFYDPVTVSNGVGIITDAGEEINRPVIHWEDPADANNYDITENYGTLIIHSLPVEIDLGGYNYESDDGSFPYDGEFHGPNVWPSCNDEGFEVNKVSDTDWTIVWSDRGDTIHIHVEGGGKDVGTYTFTYTVSVSPGKSGNYNISFTGETLTISSLTIEETPSIVEG